MNGDDRQKRIETSKTRGADSTQRGCDWSQRRPKRVPAHAFYKRCIFKIARGFLSYDPVLRQQLLREEGGTGGLWVDEWIVGEGGFWDFCVRGF